MQETVAQLKKRGYIIDYFTGAENIDGCKVEAESDNVYDYAFCKTIPYPVILTAATHIPANKYKHKQANVVHMPHSMVSLHTIFSLNTFQNFDHILCCGPHHLREANAIYKRLGRPVGLHAVGYEYIDRLARLPRIHKLDKQRPKVLVAPTWGKSSLLAVHGRRVVDCLIREADVILRPHPFNLERIQPVINSLLESYAEDSRFELDNRLESIESISRADILISDASGIAFEFALGCLKPVIFVKGPRKHGYLPWQEILNEDGIEVRCRREVGIVADSIDDLVPAVKAALANLQLWSERLDEARGRLLFNPGSCAVAAAETIDAIVSARAKIM